MISYYDLMLLVKANKQPYKILIRVDKDRELLFEFNYRDNGYRVVPTTVSEPFYKEYGTYLYQNINEEKYFERNIKIVAPYLFTIGEYVSYYDLVTAIRFNTQPYKVRIHVNDLQQDYIFDSLDLSEPRKYIVFKPDYSLDKWDFELSHQISNNSWFEKNIEVIEAGNSLIRILEGCHGSSYFNIVPIKIKNINDNTDETDNLEGMWDEAISIEEEDIRSFLFPLLKKYFNPDLVENKNRFETDDEFEWYLTNNYYQFDSIEKMIKEIKEIINLLKNDYYNSKLNFIKEDYGWILYHDSRIDNRNIPAKEQCEELIKNYTDEIINFYKRFIYCLQKMMISGEKEGYNLISVIGP